MPETDPDTFETPATPIPAILLAGTPFMQAQADGHTVVSGTPALGETMVMSDGSAVTLETGFDVATAKDGLL